jgi:hypothetical protein
MMAGVDASQRSARLELVATLLLAFATVATAWSAYQARQWTGEQATSTSRATATRIDGNRSAALANQQTQVDVATFIAWADAYQEQRKPLADFYEQRFRDEFKPAFAAWLATEPRTNPSAPSTPLAMPEYRLAAAGEAESQERAAAALSARAGAANQRADNYMLAVVLFATSLFFAGTATKLESQRARAALLGLGCVIFAGTLVWVATFPVELSI